MPKRFVGPAEARFWAKVVKSGPTMPGMSTPCWTWTGAHNRKGYGLFALANGSSGLAHRFAYETVVGPVPPGLGVLHRCNNRGCPRPDHLYPGDQKQNMRDRDALGRNGVYTKPERLRRGEQHPGSRYSDPQIAEMRRMWGAGRTARQIAEAFGGSVDHVRRICKGEKRKELLHVG